MLRLASALLVGVVAGASLATHAAVAPQQAGGGGAAGAAGPAIELGNFSVSLVVKDVAASLAFYEKLGFKKVFGGVKQRFVIVQNATATLGLFQGGIEATTLTFNPGWDRAMKTQEKFDDVRALQELLEERGVELELRADPDSTGPASVRLLDPDGHAILLDQHVPKPK